MYSKLSARDLLGPEHVCPFCGHKWNTFVAHPMFCPKCNKVISEVYTKRFVKNRKE